MSVSQFIAPVLVKYGVGAHLEIPEVVRSFGSKRVLIITDSGVAAAGVAGKVGGMLEREFETRVYDKVVPEPTIQQITRGVEEYNSFHPDVIIGLGGGSSMDSAKAIRGIAEAGGRVETYEGFNKFAGFHPKGRLICIPTTAGTGSEVGCWSMVIDTDRRYKMALADDTALMPELSIVDPELSTTLPPETTGRTGMDAFCHAMEAYVARNHSHVTDGLCLCAMRLVSRSLKRAYADGENIEARADMASAAMIAGIAINNVDCGAVHAIGEIIGARCGLPHGLMMGAFTPYVMKYNSNAAADRMLDVAEALGADSRLGAEAAWKSSAELAGAVGIPLPSRLGIDPADIPEIASLCPTNPSSAGNPRPMAPEDYRELLEESLSVDLW